MSLKIIILASLFVLFVTPAGAQDKPGTLPGQEIGMSPEVSAYNSKAESFYRTLKLLDEKPDALPNVQHTTLQTLRLQVREMQKNLKKDVKQHPHMDAYVRPLNEMAKGLDQVDKQLTAGQVDQANKSLDRVYYIAATLYKKPVVQLVVAEQKTNAAIKMIQKKQYADAVSLLDRVIDRLSQIKVPKGAPYLDEFEALKSRVLALRMQAGEKVPPSGYDKTIKAVEKSFDTAHESVFAGVWTGPMNMQKLR